MYSFTRTTLWFVSGFTFIRCQLVFDWFSTLRNSSQGFEVIYKRMFENLLNFELKDFPDLPFTPCIGRHEQVCNLQFIFRSSLWWKSKCIQENQTFFKCWRFKIFPHEYIKTQVRNTWFLSPLVPSKRKKSIQTDST